MNKGIALFIILFGATFIIYFFLKNPTILKTGFSDPLGFLLLKKGTPPPPSPIEIKKQETTQKAPSFQEPLASSSAVIEKPKITPPFGFSVDELSPDYQKIRLVSVSVSQYYGNQISLRADYNNKTPILATGLKIKSHRGEVIIPQAINDYLPLGLSQASDIYLSPNGLINIYESHSFYFNPINQSLRLNKCLGYLNNTYKFSPPLPNNCPNIVEENRGRIRSLSGYCQNYIYSLGSCQMPTANELNFYGMDYNCGNFLKDINYSNCYNKHRFDRDFFSDEYWIWLPTIPLDPYHDEVWLFDKNNLLIDEYIY